MNDLISRQAAIDKINKRQRKLTYCFGFENDMVKIMNIAKSIIIAIPSVQPEIIRCENCKHWEGEKRGQFWYFEQCSLHQCTASSDDFCSWAERGEQDE